MIPGETLHTGAAKTCPDCGHTPFLEVLSSAAGGRGAVRLIRGADYRPLKRWKYQLLDDHSIHTGWRPPAALVSAQGWVRIEQDGRLTVYKGYAWDGPSGPSIDTPSFMRGSLFHDALYQLIREGLLADTDGADRLRADELIRNVCLDDGMPAWRAAYVYRLLRWFGARAATPREETLKNSND